MYRQIIRPILTYPSQAYAILPRPFLAGARLEEARALAQDQSMQYVSSLLSICRNHNLDVPGLRKVREFVLRAICAAAGVGARCTVVSAQGA